jgi:hypothetical protein
MLPDICFKIGENWDESGQGNALLGGGVNSNATIDDISGGVTYADNKLVTGGCVGKPVLSAMAQAPSEFVIALYDDKDESVDLTNTDNVLFIAREMTYTNTRYIEKDVPITDAVNGQITLTFTKDDVPYAGLWEAAFQLRNDADEVQAEFRIYLELQKGMHYEISSRIDPITIGEVRMALFDRCPDDNSFLDDVEFKDTEIVYAIRRAVDLWNEEKPVIAGALYTMSTFPYRYHGTNAAVGQLLVMKGNNLMRNRMPLNTGQGTIDDKERANPYIQEGRRMIEEYRQWMRTEKSRINAHNVFGGTRRPAAPIYGVPRNTR